MRTKDEIDVEFAETVENPPAEDEDIQIVARDADRMHCPVCGSRVDNVTRPAGDPETFFFACKFCLSETFVRLPIDLSGEPERTN